MKRITLLFFTLFQLTGFSQDSLAGIQNDIMLHPADAFTGYTLKKNEFVYNQSPFTLPLPSWAWWGITDKITMEIDLLPLVGGFFQEPHLPVPSFNFRFKLNEAINKQPQLAFETMFQYLWQTQNQSDLEELFVERQGGWSFFNRINASGKLGRKTFIHSSAGITYTQNLLVHNNDSMNYVGKFFKHTINPDFSLSIDYRWRPWISTHFTSSYGTTFVYLDNIPRKYQLSYGFRVAPFYQSRFGILRCFRAELIGLYIYMPDSKSAIKQELPIFPYFYWQWTLKKKTESQKPKD